MWLLYYLDKDHQPYLAMFRSEQGLHRRMRENAWEIDHSDTGAKIMPAPDKWIGHSTFWVKHTYLLSDNPNVGTMVRTACCVHRTMAKAKGCKEKMLRGATFTVHKVKVEP